MVRRSPPTKGQKGSLVYPRAIMNALLNMWGIVIFVFCIVAPNIANISKIKKISQYLCENITTSETMFCVNN